MAVHTVPRTQSAGRTLVSLLLIPLLSLAGLWGFTASITFGNVISNQHINTITNTNAPSIIGLGAAVQAERALSISWLSSGRKTARLRALLLTDRQATDTSVAAVRTATTSVRGLESATGQASLDAFLATLANLPSTRAAVDAGKDSPVTAFSAYTTISAAELAFFRTGAPPTDPNLSLMTQASIQASSAEDFTSGAIALIGSALAANGQLKPAERTLFAQVVAEQNLEIGDSLSVAPPQLAGMIRATFNSPAYRQLLALENQVLDSAAGQRVPITAAADQAMNQAIQASVSSLQARLGGVLAADAASLSSSLQTELYLSAGLGLAAIVASIFVMVRFGRRLRRELTSLYNSARQMADERLPRLVSRLRDGDDVDVQAESPPLPTGHITEIANVAQAFSSVQRTAIEAAVGQAALRKGVNQVFVSLSLRNQSLLHRQLGMLDDMERATSDPVALADLFRLDHLTTRMRRHAEGLLILAGSTPGRGWRDPVPAADVLNAAVAEVEDYVRVDVVTESADAVAGTAVNDVIHLLAELVENATVFSPPNTRVEVRGDSAGTGFAIEVVDRGLGMPPEEIAALNARLATPPEFDLANSDQLGLFVAARLAQRHGVKISLRQSPFGGTTAIVLLPLSVIVSANGASWPAGPAQADDAGWGTASGSLNGSAGPAHDQRPSWAEDGTSAFGLTGRHRRLGSTSEPGPVPIQQPAPFPGGSMPHPALPERGPVRPALPASDAAPREAPGPPWDRPEPPPAPGEAPAPNGWFSPGRTGREAAFNDTDFADVTPDDTAFRQASPGDATTGGSRPGLPRRARGANLAPQLRRKLGTTTSGDGSQQPAWPGATTAAAPEEPPARSPEEASGLLSALQGGWERARTDNLDDFDGEDQP